MKFNVVKEGRRQLKEIKKDKSFPYETGNLKFNAVRGDQTNAETYRIKFDSVIAPYVVYLQEGSRPHDIPKAFGRDLPFGIGGRFDGKFHPGSTKHKGFIDRIVENIANSIAKRYKGVVQKL